MKEILVCLVYMFVFTACDRSPNDSKHVYMVNNSSQKIVLIVAASNYPDTVNFELSGCSTKDIANIVSPGESKSIIRWGYWETWLEQYPYKTAMYFVYNADSAAKIADNKIGCDSLLKRPDLILKRFDVTIDYLNHNDWKLVYP